MWQAWINVIAGIWAIISSTSAPLFTTTNFLITGAVIAVFGFWTPKHKWQGYVNGALGVWLIISSFVPALQTAINFLVVGIVVAALALWRALETGTRAGRHAPTGGHA
ncbi:MAG: hypothetical protein GF401_08865 [Chitinivibrionales bacterium]|nr:hypothetical protein [Chitinivibrionales bacterium]